jgi:hypothetical protein
LPAWQCLHARRPVQLSHSGCHRANTSRRWFQLSQHPLQQQSALGFRDAQAAAYWACQTRGLDWSQEDRIPAVLFNQILWKGLTGGLPYPAVCSGQDLSHDRAVVLKDRSTHFLYQVLY